MVFGMNWDYTPIGTNYAYNLWDQPDAVIEAALAREMPLLQGMGVNAIRQYVGIPPRWVRYIYEQYGIFTVLNHPLARYGFTLNGVWIPTVDYSDPRLRAAVKAEVVALVEQFRDTPGILIWLLGNENNYGLSWSSFEIEALPEGERNAARARHLYSLFGEVITAVKSADPARPVAMANGDLQYIDIIAEECRDLDIFGTNVYRGISARDLFAVVKEKLDRPVLFTEFGADAWNAREMREDQPTQARYLIGQWREIYEQSRGKGRVGNAIGGLVFQWSDGWWKYRQEERLDVHDTNASWPNGGYREDFVEGENNMNEEWWGICAKGPTDSHGLFDLYPRAAYYALRRAFRLDPYAPTTTPAAISAHFVTINPMSAALEARGDRASLELDALRRFRVSGLRLEFETISTGGERITTPDATEPGDGSPAFKGYDHLESYYAELQARPSDQVSGTLTLNLLGNVPENPIDEIFYENRGRERTIRTEDGTADLSGLERVRVYRAGFSWDDRWFQLDGFYRTGHLHWGYEGDFFGLYRDAYYGENIDLYKGEAPVGFEIAGKRTLSGLKVAYGPQLWWGANPGVLVKYRRSLLGVQATGIYHEEFTAQSTVTSSFAVPQPPTRKATLQLAGARGRLGYELGGIWAGETKIGDTFQVAQTANGQGFVLQDEVRASDTFGAKAKLTLQRGVWNWYLQSAYMGIVADAGPTAIPTYTGWSLKDTGSGNQSNVIGGFTVTMGRLQFGPNFLYQKPLVGPVPNTVAAPGRPRNVLDDPFAVRANRETAGAELLLCWDPTPATWLWQWDNDLKEDARLAGSLGFSYRDQRTTQDAAIGLLADGVTTFAFPGAPPPREIWEARARTVSRLSNGLRLITHAFAGIGEPNGSDTRLVRFSGIDGRLAGPSAALSVGAKFNHWGPYDYHRDFNLTYPVQLTADASRTLGAPQWFDLPQTKIGLRGTWRSLDRYSPRYCPGGTIDASGNVICNPNAPGEDGREWELRTYVHIGS
ncbi:MAG: glycosidase [Candidatus Eisenbacteria bacterium]|nr:glycosidase [Candidatus Eisenbacteria bacterium]